MNEALKATKTCALAVWSLILGVLSLMCFGMFSGIPAVICGHLARSRIKHSDGTLSGDGLAIGGLVTGYIGTVLTSIAILGMLAGMLLPAVAAARDRARRTQCMNNLSQIGKCCVMYAMDHDEQFPPNLNTLAAESDASNPHLYVCPATGNEPGDLSTVNEWSDYVLVPNRSANDPSDGVLAFSRPECYPRKGGNVLTVDGAVQWCNLAEYEELTAEFRRQQ